MSRWLSPEKAARRAQRAEKDAEQRRQEKRRSVLLMVCLTIISLGLMVGDYLLLRSQAKQRHEQRYHRGGKTNDAAFAVPRAAPNQVKHHE